MTTATPGATSVSIIVPVYNGEKTLPALLDSILHLDYPRERFEAIIVDNNSRDRTRELVREAGLTCLSEGAQGSYAARNRGLAAATGDIIGFTDADCIVDPGWVREAVAAFSRPEVGAVAGGIVGHDPDNYVVKYLVETNYFDAQNTLRHPFMPYAPTANVFYRKKVFERVGNFRAGWPSGGDADLAWRMQLETDFGLEFVPQALVRHVHRSTLRSLFDQNLFWGKGAAQLYAAYYPRWRRSPAQRLREYRAVTGAMTRAAFALARGRKESPEVVRAAMLTGSKLGQLIGTIRYGGGHW